jgi:hypothetical protein
MPCGGIYPVHGSWVEKQGWSGPITRCWVCNKTGSDHFCDEWDTGLHYACIPRFLSSDEGQIVIAHKHNVYMTQGE